MTLGMLVRDDQGGLGNLTYRAWRELRPEVTVVVQWRPCRGVPNPDKFRASWTRTVFTDRPIPDRLWRGLAGDVDVWWSAESWYSVTAERLFMELGQRSVLYAMPELYAGSDASEVWNPTGYLSDRPRLGDVMPWPLSPAPTPGERSRVRNVLHVSGGATGDRNGTTLMVEALRQVTAPMEVVLHQPERRHQLDRRTLHSFAEHVNIRATTNYVDDLDSLLGWADVLVLPRRYAGLCLPAFEAFQVGCPVVMPNVAPQDGWPIIPVPGVPDGTIRLRGGRVPRWTVDPTVLAGVLDELAGWDAGLVQAHSRRVHRWAQEHSWERYREQWEGRLRG